MKKAIAMLLATVALLVSTGAVFAAAPGAINSLNGSQPGGCMAKTHGECIN